MKIAALGREGFEPSGMNGGKSGFVDSRMPVPEQGASKVEAAMGSPAEGTSCIAGGGGCRTREGGGIGSMNPVTAHPGTTPSRAAFAAAHGF